ncbi:MAG: glycosyltransferase family 4 protein [Candidatus Berkelbacteria bacterium]
MKIAILAALDTPVSADSLGGTEIWTHQYAEELISKGHDVTLFASEGSSFPGKLFESAKRSDVELPGQLLQVSREKIVEFSIRQIEEVIKIQDQFDIIHLSNCNFDFYLPYVKKFHKPVVLTVHSYNFSGEKAEELFLKYPEVFYVFNANSFKKTWPEPRHYCVIHTGINLANFEFNQSPENYIFWMGRIHKDKGIEDAIEFAKKTGEKMIIAGPIRDQEYFDLEVGPYLSSNIEYVGELDHKKKVQYYKQAKAFLMTTKRDESFGLVAAESLACGTPVIAYDRGALSEVISDNETGFIVEPDNIEQLVEKSKLIDSVDRAACRQRVEKNFNISAMTDKYLELYKKLMEEGYESKN